MSQRVPDRPAGDGVRLSIVIPTLHDEEALARLLAALRPATPRPSREPAAEIIVSDGGSGDGAARIAREHGALFCEGSPGRGAQMNRGAALARGETLWFLHADAGVPEGAAGAIAGVLRDPRVVGGAFRFRLAAQSAWAPILDAVVNLRSRWLRLPYGDQGYFVRSDVFRALGGFGPLPILEDLDFIRRLRRRGQLVLLPAALSVSARRWEAEGFLRATVRNQLLVAAYAAGVPPAKLARWYPAARAGARTARGAAQEALLVFAKRPEPGAVKTRLAAAVGPRRAAELYARMCRVVFDGVAAWRRPGVRRVAVVSPAEAVPEVAARLPGGFEAWPQSEGDLGARMAAAFAAAFRAGARRACVIGTDCVDLTPELLDRAFDALAANEAVVGPAADGGYWLLGLSRPVPEAFRGVPWSTERVLHATLERLAGAGIDPVILPVLRDLDTVDDLVARAWLR